MGNRGAEGKKARLEAIAECSPAAAREHRDLSCAQAVSAVHSLEKEQFLPFGQQNLTTLTNFTKVKIFLFPTPPLPGAGRDRDT